MDALADAALAARARFEPRELAHMLWNMSRLGYVDDPFFLAFVPGAPGRGSGFCEGLQALHCPQLGRLMRRAQKGRANPATAISAAPCPLHS